MIIEADFLNHWKTKALGNAIGDLEAIRALLSLWAHCQKRRAWEFRLTAVMLAGICDYHGDKTKIDAFWDTMRELQFIDTTPESGWFRVHEWGETNISLVAKWAAPMKRKATDYPPRGAKAASSDHSYDASSDQTLDASSVPAIGLDRIGEDRIGLEKKADIPKAPKGADLFPMPLEWSETRCQTMRTWLDYRNSSRKRVKPASWPKLIEMLAVLDDAALEACVSDSVANGWQGLFPDKFRVMPSTNGSQIAQKKEGGALLIRPADFPWKTVANYCEGWSPEGEWEDQTARTRKTLRETWGSLSDLRRSEVLALAEEGGALP
jgi:hypothetical protein